MDKRQKTEDHIRTEYCQGESSEETTAQEMVEWWRYYNSKRNILRAMRGEHRSCGNNTACYNKMTDAVVTEIVWIEKLVKGLAKEELSGKICKNRCRTNEGDNDNKGVY